MTYEDKKDEIETFVDDYQLTCGSNIDYRIIIQHFCIETWALANRSIVNRYSSNIDIQKFRSIWDVLYEDPELLPSLPEEKLNRAQFAEKYLRLLLNEKYRNLTYTKNNPKEIIHRKYFDKIKSRCIETGHIASFKDFLNAFYIDQ